MDAKVSFGLDFLNIMANAGLRSGKDENRNAYNLARLFLMTDWGLSVQEGDEANQLFWQAVNKNSLEDLKIVAERFIPHLKKDAAASTKFITEMMTINFLDGQITDDEKEFTLLFANDLDFRRSEIEAMATKAYDFAQAYDWFGDNFTKKAP
jgi:hypothetical protein